MAKSMIPDSIVWVGEIEPKSEMERTLINHFGAHNLVVDIITLGNGNLIQVGEGTISDMGAATTDASQDCCIDTVIASYRGKVIAWWGNVDIQKS